MASRMALAVTLVFLAICLSILPVGWTGEPSPPPTVAPLASGSSAAPQPLRVSASAVGGPALQAAGSPAPKQMHLIPTPLPLIPPRGNLTPDAPTGTVATQFTLTKGGPAVPFYLDLPLAKAFQVQNVSATLYLKSVSNNIVALDVNLTVYDWNGGALTQVVGQQWRVQTNGVSSFQKFTFVFVPVNYTFPRGDQILLQVLNANTSGDSALLAMNTPTLDSQLDVLTTTFVNIDQLLLLDGKGSATVWSPKDSLVIQANVSDPFGSREIAGAAVNATSPLGILVLNGANMSILQSGTAWTLFQSTIPPLLTNGTYAVVVTARERNGVTDGQNATALVRAPAITLVKIATVAQAQAGNRFSYYLYYNNTGTGPAGRVWINDTLPSALSYQWSVPLPSSIVGATYSWVFNDVTPGNHSIQIRVQVKSGTSGVAYVRNWASLNYTDEKGYLWPMSMAHVDVVLNGPVMALSVWSAPASRVHSSETVIYTIELTNTGDGANTIWVNVTIPAGLAYFSDTAGTLGGSRTNPAPGIEAYTFTNMPPGTTTTPVTWSFTLTAHAAATLTPGTVLTTTVRVNDTSTNDLPMPEQVRAAPLTVSAPFAVSAAVLFASSMTVPNQAVPVFVNFTNAGNEAAPTVWINLTLDPALQFLGASVPSTLSNNVAALVMSNAAVGADSVSISVAASPFTPDRYVLRISGTLNYTDQYGNHLPEVDLVAGNASIAESAVAFSLSPANLTAEAGTTITYSVTGTNSGSGPASFVWLDVSLPASLVYASDTSGVLPTTLGPNMTWVWRSFTPGNHSYQLVFDVSRAAADHSSADLLFRVQSLDLGGNVQNGSDFGAHVSVIAPTIVLTLTADQNESVPGGTYSYVLQVQNTGSTAARFLWLTDTLDSHLQLISYTGPVQATGTRTLNWTFQDLQPGQSYVITLSVKVYDNSTARIWVGANLLAYYTNSRGTVLGYARSDPVQTEVIPDFLPLVYIVVGGSSLGAVAVAFVYRRYRVQIEDVFLIYRDGILISHLSREQVLEKDEDQVSGMLTAVQDFVKDAFTYGPHRELHQMEFGDYHILIERGSMVYLAVVYQGRDSGMIRKKVRAVLDQVESSYGSVFARWDGDMGEVEGTRELIRATLLSTKRPWSIVRTKAA